MKRKFEGIRSEEECSPRDDSNTKGVGAVAGAGVAMPNIAVLNQPSRPPVDVCHHPMDSAPQEPTPAGAVQENPSSTAPPSEEGRVNNAETMSSICDSSSVLLSSLTNPSTLLSTKNDVVKTCTLCCEDNKLPSEMAQLTSSCRHESCQECMVKWIQKQEEDAYPVSTTTPSTTTPATPAPTCPFCRVAIAGHDSLAILGRPFQPKVLVFSSSLVVQQALQEEELVVDDLTLHWLQERTKPCPNCGVFIEKIADGGCDKMECLCGCRFCFACGTPNASCQCSPVYHNFWNNHRNGVSYRNVTPAQAPRDDATGFVDLRRHIEQQQQQQATTRPPHHRGGGGACIGSYLESMNNSETIWMPSSADWLDDDDL